MKKLAQNLVVGDKIAHNGEVLTISESVQHWNNPKKHAVKFLEKQPRGGQFWGAYFWRTDEIEVVNQADNYSHEAGRPRDNEEE